MDIVWCDVGFVRLLPLYNRFRYNKVNHTAVLHTVYQWQWLNIGHIWNIIPYVVLMDDSMYIGITLDIFQRDKNTFRLWMCNTIGEIL